MQGQSLLLALKRERGERGRLTGRPAGFTQKLTTDRAFGWSALRALRAGKYLYIQAPERELYNQSTDPGESHNLASSAQAVTDTLAAQLADFRGKTSRPRLTGQTRSRTDPKSCKPWATWDRMRSRCGTTLKLTGVDPKVRIEISICYTMPCSTSKRRTIKRLSRYCNALWRPSQICR